MKTLLKVVVFSLLMNAFHRGHAANSGDVVYCSESSENSFNPTNNKPKSQKPKFFKKNTRHDIDHTVVNEIESEEDKLIYSLYKLTRAKTLNIAEFSDNFFEYDMKNAKGSKMPRGDKNAILQFQFIMPKFSDQSRIVSILDAFDTLTSSIKEGLPKEIELRQKQYEYFREQLLSFS